MPKMRIHELAREMGKSNKEVLEMLKTKGIEAKSHMSSLEDDQVDMIKRAFDKSTGGKMQQTHAEKPQSAPTGQEEKKQEAKLQGENVQKDQQIEQTKEVNSQEQKPKKKNIIRVFRSQNASGNLPERPRRPRRPVHPAGQGQQERPAGQSHEGARRPQENTSSQAAPQERPVHKPQQRPGAAGQSTAGQGTAGQGAAGQRAAGQGTAPSAGQSQQQKTTSAASPHQTGAQGQQTRNTDQPRRDSENRPQRDNRARQSSSRPSSSNRPQGQGTSAQGDHRRTNGAQGSDNRRGAAASGTGASRPQRTGDRDRRPREDGRRFTGGDRRPSSPGQGAPHGSRDGRQGTGSGFAAAQKDTGVRKPTRDFAKKDATKKIEQKRDERKGGNRPNQGFHAGGGRRPNQRVPKAYGKPAPRKVEEKKEVVKEIVLPEKMTIRELAEKMKMQPSVIVKKLFLEGTMVTVNHEIDFEKAQEIALGYDIIAEEEEKIDVIEELLKEDEENEKDLRPRPPVVCVMGHVDHGKTSLLDAIRHTHVTDKEAGGITQHIGAYIVKINGQKITFLDTPGHEAFTAMRMRGANATDIAILVVAADDGVMPQTVEAINHAKAAGVEIIVAINKIDKPNANIERVKQELSEYELVPEDWGGSTIFVPVSAHTHEGIENLLEMILLTAEVCELKANPKRKARGLVIEAKLDRGKGPVATILVQKGTLKQGDFIAAGSCSGKVRAMIDDKGRRVKEAEPSTPVEILGLSDVPNAGDILVATDNDKEAKNFAATFVSEGKSKLLDDTKSRMSLDDLFNQIQAGNLKELPIIVKADVQGSVEAVKQSLEKLSNEEVMVKVIHGGVGAINESDVSLASASNAIIIGFNVRPDATAKQTAEQEGVDLRLYRVIYQAIEDVEAAMKGMLDAVYEEKVIGHAQIRQIFKASGIGTIAGSYITDGLFQRGCSVRVSRGGEKIYEGPLASLKRFKDDAKEVKEGFECGLVMENFNDLKEEDEIEAYIMVEVPR